MSPQRFNEAMVILGLNPGIDSSAALVVDGRVVAAAEEERLSRIKMHLGFPRRAIREVLRLSGVPPSAVEAVTFSFRDYLYAHPTVTRLFLQENGCPFDPENPLHPWRLSRLLFKTVSAADMFPMSFGISDPANYDRNQRTYLEELRGLDIHVPTLVDVRHHVCHAASAYYTSGFDDCLVVTADGAGDGACLTISRGLAGHLEPLHVLPSSVSPGVFYASVTAHLGFKAHRHEGKITGLAAFGNPDVCNDAFEPCLRLGSDGLTLQSDFTNPSRLQRFGQLQRLWTNGYFRNPMMNAYLDHYATRLAGERSEDVAAAAQQRLEDVVIGLVRPFIERTRLRNLALAGGVFANVKVNQRLFESVGVDKIFIHPNMGDGGNALGSALYHAAERARANGQPSVTPALEHVFLSSSFSDPEIERALQRHGLPYSHHLDVEEVIGEMVAHGQIVGRFHGALEYGPRALGNRSILAHPGDRGINDVLNHRLHRTEFMPFAPSVLEEDAAEYFQLASGALRPAEFMTITCRVHAHRRREIAAVVHVDGTARPHLVRRHINPSFYRILTAFKRHTGLGVLVNTSFNIHEEPIICSPDDACRAFAQGAVDALAIGPFVVRGPGRVGTA